ncbi:MAG: hypothetical protein RI885_1707 [Actinomycetota bacterium]
MRSVVAVSYLALISVLCISALKPMPNIGIAMASTLVIASGAGLMHALRRESSMVAFLVASISIACSVIGVLVVLCIGGPENSILIVLALVVVVARFVPPAIGSQQLWFWESS